MKDNILHLKRLCTPTHIIGDLDFALIAPLLVLCVFGILAVFWAGLSPQFSNPFQMVKAKAMYIMIGIILTFLFSAIDYHLYENRGFQIGISLTVIFFLFLLFFIGPKEFGANLRFLIFNKTIQPTEYVKVFTVIVLSYTINVTYRKNLFGYFILSTHSLLFGILFVLIALQPDFGTVLIISATAFSMLVVARIRIGKIMVVSGLIAALGGGLLLIICFMFSNDFYVIERFRVFAKCLLVKGCDQYQMSNAYNTIISGRLFGTTIFSSLHTHGIIPMESNDFIFSVIAEEVGFFGVILLLFLYLLLIHRGFFIARHCRDFFGQLMSFGLTWIIGFQALINILVAIGLFPITGITLPLISQGGNSLLATMIMVGILANISKNIV